MKGETTVPEDMEYFSQTESNKENKKEKNTFFGNLEVLLTGLEDTDVSVNRRRVIYFRWCYIGKIGGRH